MTVSRLTGAIGATLIVACYSLVANAAGDDPPVAAGRDTGGRPVVIVGRGLDYRADAIASRMARDGEGEIIGYDIVDDDRRPFALSVDTKVAETIISEGQTATLIPIRVDIANLQSVANALEFGVKTPARVTLILGQNTARDMRALLIAASKLFPELLFIVAAGEGGFNLDTATADAMAQLPNVLIVTAVNADAAMIPNSNFGPQSVDLATVVDNPSQDATEIAAARIAALAVRLLAVAPDIDPAEAKGLILALAVPWPPVGVTVSRAGWIAQPQKPWFLE